MEGALTDPILYLSLYFKSHREQYYDLLQRVRTEGAWEEWLRFFMTGVQETANQAVEAARSILELFDEDRDRIDETLGQSAGSARRVHELLQRRPVVTTKQAANQLPLSRPTVTSALANLEELGIVHEMTGQERYRVYAYSAYFNILEEGTQPIQS